MKIISKQEAMVIHQQESKSRLFCFCTGKYAWHGSIGLYVVLRSVTLN